MKTPNEPAQEEATTTAKLPYRTPALRRLGSVRELTLGGSMGIFNEGLFQMKNMLKGM